MAPLITSIPSLAPNSEPFNPDRISLTLQMLSLFADYGAPSQLRLQQLKEAGFALQQITSLRSRLALRQQQAGTTPTPDLIKKAISQNEPVGDLFANDVSNLGADLQDARNLGDALASMGILMEAALEYPVILISSDSGQKEEKLLWMTERERNGLNQYPEAKDSEYAGYLARSGTDSGRQTTYICLDIHANLRIAQNAIPAAMQSASYLAEIRTDVLNLFRESVATEINGLGLLLKMFQDLVAVYRNADGAIRDLGHEELAMDARAQRMWLIRFIDIVNVLARLKEQTLLSENFQKGK